jgi:hypothetical protein
MQSVETRVLAMHFATTANGSEEPVAAANMAGNGVLIAQFGICDIPES